jgi:hypothetical protein
MNGQGFTKNSSGRKRNVACRNENGNISVLRRSNQVSGKKIDFNTKFTRPVKKVIHNLFNHFESISSG